MFGAIMGRVFDEQRVECPVCGDELILHRFPLAWLHASGSCTSPSYEQLCDPAGVGR